jgi:hypothetical protein
MSKSPSNSAPSRDFGAMNLPAAFDDLKSSLSKNQFYNLRYDDTFPLTIIWICCSHIFRN